jgi:lysozyme
MANAVGEDRSDFQSGGRSWSASDFGFSKATEGLGWQSRTFAGNWRTLKQQGKRRGAYHFFHPAESAGAQAQFFVNYVRSNGGFGPGDMFACDAEIAVGSDGTETGEPRALARMHVPLLAAPRMAAAEAQAAVGSGALVFCNAVARLVGPQCPVLLYTYLGFRSSVAACAKYPLWLADYTSSPPASVAPWSHWTIWQNSDHGGQGGGDHNYFHGDRAALESWISSFAPAPDWTEEAIMALPTLKLGDRDHAGKNQVVGKMQALVSFVGTWNKLPAAAGLKEDGHFGPTTLAAVEAVQAFYGITGGGGECGQRTWEHLIGG